MRRLTWALVVLCAFSCTTAVGFAPPRGVIHPTRFTPPARWETEYTALMQRTGRDTTRTVRSVLLGHAPAVPFRQLSFYLADSIPARLAAGATARTYVFALFDPGTRSITVTRVMVFRDSVSAALVLHEMLHAVTGEVDHRHPLFRALQEVVGNWSTRS